MLSWLIPKSRCILMDSMNLLQKKAYTHMMYIILFHFGEISCDTSPNTSLILMYFAYPLKGGWFSNFDRLDKYPEEEETMYGTINFSTKELLSPGTVISNTPVVKFLGYYLWEDNTKTSFPQTTLQITLKITITKTPLKLLPQLSAIIPQNVSQ